MNSSASLDPKSDSLRAWRRLLSHAPTPGELAALDARTLDELIKRVSKASHALRWADPRTSWWRWTCGVAVFLPYVMLAYSMVSWPGWGDPLPPGTLSLGPLLVLLTILSVAGGFALWVVGALPMEFLTDTPRELEKLLLPVQELPLMSREAVRLCEESNLCKEYCAQVRKTGRNLYAFDIDMLHRLAYDDQVQSAKLNHQQNLSALYGERSPESFGASA